MSLHDMELRITRDHAQRMLDQLPLASVFAFSVQELDRGRCTMEAPFLDLFLRPGNLVSGPIYMALADVAVWVALMTIVGPMPMAVTTELNTNFLRGAVREDVVLHGAHLEYRRRHRASRCRMHESRRAAAHASYRYV